MLDMLNFVRRFKETMLHVLMPGCVCWVQELRFFGTRAVTPVVSSAFPPFQVLVILHVLSLQIVSPVSNSSSFTIASLKLVGSSRCPGHNGLPI
jgi:hypothetical protein